MASLTHVKMWSGHSWIHITAEDAASLHPGGTVSAHSGLFMCDLCGQYVTLTAKGEKARHFRHSSYEKSKNCPERTFGSGTMLPLYSPDAHELPIKICNVSDAGFSFEMPSQNHIRPSLVFCDSILPKLETSYVYSVVLMNLIFSRTPYFFLVTITFLCYTKFGRTFETNVKFSLSNA